MSRKCNTRIKWEVGDEANKWVICLNCDYDFFIESYELDPECPVCSSKAFEEDNSFEERGDDW